MYYDQTDAQTDSCTLGAIPMCIGDPRANKVSLCSGHCIQMYAERDYYNGFFAAFVTTGLVRMD